MSAPATHPESPAQPLPLRAVRVPTLRALADQVLDRLASGSNTAHGQLLAAQALGAQLQAVRSQPETATAIPEHPWLRLADRLGLTDAEVLAGWLALLADLDPAFAARLRELQGDGRANGASRPTLGLAARAVSMLEGGSNYSPARVLARLMSGAAVASGLLRIAHEELPASDRELHLPAALLPLLSGAEPREGERCVFDSVEAELASAPAWQLPPSWERALEPVQAALSGAHDGVLVLRSHDVDEARAAAVFIAQRCGWRGAVIRPRSDAGTAAKTHGLEPWLLACAALPIHEIPAGPDAVLNLPATRFYRGPVLVAAGREGEIAGRDQVIREVLLPVPPPAERLALWQQSVPPEAAAHCETLARWRCGLAALHGVAADARRHSLSTERHEIAKALDSARATHVRSQVRRLGALAQPIDAVVGDEAFVTGSSERSGLDLFAMHCAERETLMENLGPVMRARAHPGVKALFVGASGTGKTLAAQWLAHRLGKPLLRVDTASVTSKYIGETEKNLATLLAQAEHLDCLLLFDEADALFGARTDVKQSNDRFANAQTNYLLTRIESFDGIAILTSNSKSRFDDAFIRRLDAIVEFRLPGALERRRLWLAHLGDAHALQPEQIAWFAAQFELPGGNIRNAVLGAALLARQRSAGLIGVADIQGALLAEYRKLGRAAPDGAAPAS